MYSFNSETCFGDSFKKSIILDRIKVIPTRMLPLTGKNKIQSYLYYTTRRVRFSLPDPISVFYLQPKPHIYNIFRPLFLAAQDILQPKLA